MAPAEVDIDADVRAVGALKTKATAAATFNNAAISYPLAKKRGGGGTLFFGLLFFVSMIFSSFCSIEALSSLSLVLSSLVVNSGAKFL